MNTELVTYTDTLDDLQRTAKMLAVSGLFEAKGDSPAAIARIAVAIMAGREMGMGPFAAVQGIHVIQGRPTLAANLMAAAVKAHPRYDYRVRELTDAQATIEFFELAGGKRESLGVSTFTQADAMKAQTKNLDKFARNMLFARAISNGVRWFCPDVFSGNAVYSPEEMDADIDPETGEILDGTYTVRQSESTGANGNGPGSLAGFPSDPEKSVEDNPFVDERPARQGETIQANTLKRLHAVGGQLYRDEWSAKRPELIRAISTGAVTSSKELLEPEARRLIAGMEARLAKMQQPDVETKVAAK